METSINSRSLWNLTFWISVSVILSQATVGERFYKAAIGPLYLTEFLILLSWGLILPFALKRGRFPRIPWLTPFFLLAFVYALFSFFLIEERGGGWVIRQSAFLLYVSVVFFAYSFARRSPHLLPSLLRWAGWLGSVLVVITPSSWMPGNTDYTSGMIFLIGYAYWLVKAKTTLSRCAIALLVSVLYVLHGGHASFMVAPPLLLFAILFLEHPKIRLPFFLLGALTAGMVLTTNPEFSSDPNATWRYGYWQAILQDSWNRGGFLLGKGFGIQYLPAEAENFQALIHQVEVPGLKTREFQLMTVPPHNVFLTLLIYFGLPGIIFFLLPYFPALRLASRRKLPPVPYAFFLACLGMMEFMAANQSLEFPYVAMAYWSAFGLMLGSVPFSGKAALNEDSLPA